MSNIKVTVAYEKPTTSKFDALMAEYEAAKKMADETVAYYKPLADAAEEAKFDAIMEQLEPIKEYAVRISEITNRTVAITANISASICGSANSDGEEFSVMYRPKDKLLLIRSAWQEFSRKQIKYYTEGSHNFIGNWDEWKVYEKLEAKAIRLLREEIAKQKSRVTEQIDRLHNITKEDN